jgi:hypothetical protein
VSDPRTRAVPDFERAGGRIASANTRPVASRKSDGNDVAAARLRADVWMAQRIDEVCNLGGKADSLNQSLETWIGVDVVPARIALEPDEPVRALAECGIQRREDTLTIT